MKTRYVQMLVAVLLLETLGFGTTDAQSQEFSSFEYNQASNTVTLEWKNSSNALYEMQASTNLIPELWGQTGGWTNILGTNPTNSIQLSADGHINGFFRLLARTNSPQQSVFSGMALRANYHLISGGIVNVSPLDPPIGSLICTWDNWAFECTMNGAVGGWTSTNLEITNNQTFFYFPSTGEDLPSEWSHAYIKDWRLISPEDLPVTGSVPIEWSAFESSSTPSNPVPDIPVVYVSVMNAEEVIVTDWLLEAPSTHSVIWESHSYPNGYYRIEVDVGSLETIRKKVYLYN